MVSERWFSDNGALLEGSDSASLFSDLKVAHRGRRTARGSYSVTGDVLAFLRCSRQYGFFAVRHYVPAQATQLYFGIVIHEVLDRLHRQFRGHVEGKPIGLPSDDDVTEYFRAVTEALRTRGIRPYSRRAERTALEYLQRFNTTCGPVLYPRVRETEYKLRANEGEFFLHGVVDVLARSASNPTGTEIWDYKGSTRVASNSEEMRAYEFQMRVYAELYRRKAGVLPEKAVLCFLGEPDLKSMLVEIAFDARSIQNAMTTFRDTVKAIEDRDARDDWSPPDEMPDRATCAACDLRWDCPTSSRLFPMRYP